jgi:glucan-binding YG repeat protein
MIKPVSVEPHQQTLATTQKNENDEKKEIRRVTIASDGTDGNDESAIFHWMTTRPVSSAKENVEEDDNDDNDADDDESDDASDAEIDVKALNALQREDCNIVKYGNIRASILSSSSTSSSTSSEGKQRVITGDAIWMRRNGDNECVALVEADRNAALRFQIEQQERKIAHEKQIRYQKQQEKNQEMANQLKKQKERRQSLSPTNASHDKKMKTFGKYSKATL